MVEELEPIMCVDKTLDELSNFTDLVTESESIEPNWQLVLVACLSARNSHVLKKVCILSVQRALILFFLFLK
jgi:hypothetical protein